MVAMTTREPTEAMRETAIRAARLGMGTDYAADARWARTLVAEIARALAEQDTAARREAWITGFKEAQQKAALMVDKRAPKPLADGKMSATAASAAIACEDLARLIRALTPEPPSEKENEGDVRSD